MLTDETPMPALPAVIAQLLDRLRGQRQVSVVIVTTRGQETVRMPLRDLRRS
jgi:hypothetical protein